MVVVSWPRAGCALKLALTTSGGGTLDRREGAQAPIWSPQARARSWFGRRNLPLQPEVTYPTEKSTFAGESDVIPVKLQRRTLGKCTFAAHKGVLRTNAKKVLVFIVPRLGARPRRPSFVCKFRILPNSSSGNEAARFVQPRDIRILGKSDLMYSPL